MVSDSATPWTVARQAPLSVEFFRLEYRSGLPFPTPGNLPDPGIEPWHLLHCRWILYHFTIWESLIYKWKISIGKSERYREEKGRLLG